MKISFLLIILGLSQVLGQNWGPLTESKTEINIRSLKRPLKTSSVVAAESKGQLISRGNFGVFKSNKKCLLIFQLASKNWSN